MAAIEEITKRNTGEYAIRPFIRKYQKQTHRVDPQLCYQEAGKKATHDR